MKIRTLLIKSFIFLFFFVLVGSSQVAAFDLEIPFETIDKGDISHYRYNDDCFAGADLIIKNKKTWAHFWAHHTAGIQPPPPLPDIDFKKELVIVAILGIQSSGGGPGIQVLEVSVNNSCWCLEVLIEDDTTPGPLDVITNPFHIIKLRRGKVPSIIFEHQKPLDKPCW